MSVNPEDIQTSSDASGWSRDTIQLIDSASAVTTLNAGTEIPLSMNSSKTLMTTSPEASSPLQSFQEDQKQKEREELIRMRIEATYQSLQTLISRLFNNSVTEEDGGIYVDTFLLTYRRFTTPRTLLLALQFRLRELNARIHSAGGASWGAVFARSRLANLLCIWMERYPQDFYATGSKGAMEQVYKTICTTDGLLEYVAEIGQFVTTVLDSKEKAKDKDIDWEWAVTERIEEDTLEEEDESGTDHSFHQDPCEGDSDANLSILEDVSRKWLNSVRSIDDNVTRRHEPSITQYVHPTPAVYSHYQGVPFSKTASPTAGTSHPEAASELELAGNTQSRSHPSSGLLTTIKLKHDIDQVQVLKCLNILLPQVLNADPVVIAVEITKIQLEWFLKIKPRDWIRDAMLKSNTESVPDGHPSSTSPARSISKGTARMLKATIAAGKSRQSKDPLRTFVDFYNRLGLWVTSLILTPSLSSSGLRMRVKSLAKFLSIARELRNMHNYSGLRAVLSGVMNASFEGDRMMEMFSEVPEMKDLWQKLRSYILLMSSAKNHGNYRMALSSVMTSADGVLPEAEIHTSDVVRVHSVNPDFKPANSSPVSNTLTEPPAINWNKFASMGRIVADLTLAQKRCRKSMAENHGRMNFSIGKEGEDVRSWLLEWDVMDDDMIQSRIPQPDAEEGGHSGTGTIAAVNEHGVAGSMGKRRLTRVFEGLWEAPPSGTP